MRKVAVIIKSPPHGKYLASEGLRIATALTLYEQEIYVIAISDGVYTFLKDAEKPTYETHIDVLIESEVKILIDEDDAQKRSVGRDDLIDGAELTQHNEIVGILSKCDATLVF